MFFGVGITFGGLASVVLSPPASAQVPSAGSGQALRRESRFACESASSGWHAKIKVNVKSSGQECPLHTGFAAVR
jgi:hypothetical protein